MDPNKIDALKQWRNVVEHERHLRGRLKSADGELPSGEDLRQWWSAAADVWSEYSRLVASGLDADPSPGELAVITSKMFGYLAVGQLPGPMRDAAPEGRRRPGPDERQDIEIAVAYHKSAMGGLEHNGQQITIADRTPTKTIASHYGVAPETARKWFRNYSPAFLGVNDVNAETLVALMKTAAKRYGAAGRSAKAISSRNAKRHNHPPRN